MGPNCPNCNADHTNVVDDGWHVFECGSRAFFCIDGKVKALPSSLCNRMVALAADNERLTARLREVREILSTPMDPDLAHNRSAYMEHGAGQAARALLAIYMDGPVPEHPDTARLREVKELAGVIMFDALGYSYIEAILPAHVNTDTPVRVVVTRGADDA